MFDHSSAVLCCISELHALWVQLRAFRGNAYRITAPASFIFPVLVLPRTVAVLLLESIALSHCTCIHLVMNSLRQLVIDFFFPFLIVTHIQSPTLGLTQKIIYFA